MSEYQRNMKIVSAGTHDYLDVSPELVERSSYLKRQNEQGVEIVAVNAVKNSIEAYLFFLETGILHDYELTKDMLRAMGHKMCPSSMNERYCEAIYEDAWYNAYGEPDGDLLHLVDKKYDPPEYDVGTNRYFFLAETALTFMNLLIDYGPRGIQVGVLDKFYLSHRGFMDKDDTYYSYKVPNPLYKPRSVPIYKVNEALARYKTNVEPHVKGDLTTESLWRGRTTPDSRNMERARREFRSSFVHSGILTSLTPDKTKIDQPTPEDLYGHGYIVVGRTTEEISQEKQDTIVLDTLPFGTIKDMIFSLQPAHRQVVMDQNGNVWMSNRAHASYSYRTLVLETRDLKHCTGRSLLQFKNNMFTFQYSTDIPRMRQEDAIRAFKFLLEGTSNVRIGKYYHISFNESTKSIADTIDRYMAKNQQIPESWTRMIGKATMQVIYPMSWFYAQDIYNRWIRMNEDSGWLLAAQLLKYYDFVFDCESMLFPMEYPIRIAPMEWQSTE